VTIVNPIRGFSVCFAFIDDAVTPLLIAPNYLCAPGIFAMVIVSSALPHPHRKPSSNEDPRVRPSLFAEVDQGQSARVEGGQIHRAV
jgi:hypothetical protein